MNHSVLPTARDSTKRMKPPSWNVSTVSCKSVTVFVAINAIRSTKRMHYSRESAGRCFAKVATIPLSVYIVSNDFMWTVLRVESLRPVIAAARVTVGCLNSSRFAEVATTDSFVKYALACMGWTAAGHATRSTVNNVPVT